MVRLIDDLLDVSRITSGKIQLQREPTPLATLVNRALEANRAAIAAKRLDLTVDLPESPCVLNVDPTRLVQVLSNLLHNAVKFTEAGGAIGIVGRVTAGAGSGALVLSVRDSGIGIPRDFQPRVFDLFTQGERSSSDPGLGIGLALARQLVEMHDGRIDVRSQGAGQGSEFVIRLPLSTEAPRERAPEAPAARGLDCRVLVIDDNRDAAAAIALLVEHLGGDCRVAHDGADGLREIATYRPDVVLLDIGMPGIDGYETCRRLRQEFGDDLAVVAVTGFGQEQDKQQASLAGFTAHLTKPADPEALAALLRKRATARRLRAKPPGPTGP
jgi:CheY-like chemotaxis protein